MSDHFDASDLRTDITDLYLFPGLRVDRTVLVLDVNPEPSTAEASVDPAASYTVANVRTGTVLGTFSGAQLRQGLTIALAAPFSAAVLSVTPASG